MSIVRVLDCLTSEKRMIDLVVNLGIYRQEAVAATSPRRRGDFAETSPWLERKLFLVSRVARVAATGLISRGSRGDVSASEIGP